MSLWDSIAGPLINTGIQTGLGFLAGSQQGGQSVRVSGNEAMAARVPQVMAMFATLESQIPQLLASGATPDQIVSEAQRIASIFSDDRYFDQQIGGDSRRIREAAQRDAAARVAAIAAALSQQPVGGGQPGNPYTGVPAASSGFDTSTLFLIGGGLVLFLFLRD